LPPTTPTDWLSYLEQKLVVQQRKIELFEDYYAGRHRLAFATLKFRQSFGWLFNALADNWCLPTGSPVVSPQGLRPIEDFEVGDLAIGHDGQPHAVTGVSVRPVDEQIVRFRTLGSDVCRMTDEHPVLATRRDSMQAITAKYSTDEHFRCYGTGANLAFRRDSVEREWIPAGELQKGDLVWAPVRHPAKGRKLDEGWARLLGWYLAEGSVSDNGRVAFTLHGDEVEAQDEIERRSESDM
jgi:hypothetical protein